MLSCPNLGENEFLTKIGSHHILASISPKFMKKGPSGETGQSNKMIFNCNESYKIKISL